MLKLRPILCLTLCYTTFCLWAQTPQKEISPRTIFSETTSKDTLKGEMEMEKKKEVLSLLDLNKPGLEQVAGLLSGKIQPRKSLTELLSEQKEIQQIQQTNSPLERIEAASKALLQYYRLRHKVSSPYVDLKNTSLSKEEQRWADEALEHRFFVHVGYQPSYFYGKDINWQYWPVKDNELRWQLHRMKWWVPMGKAYHLTKDEKYAKEWCSEYLDWMQKNPLISKDIPSSLQGKELIQRKKLIENVGFAWRPLEVSDRLEFQIQQFLYFLPSEHFDADFLLNFLDNYHRHAVHLTQNFSSSGNHLLFQAQRLIFAGVFFPEFKEAAAWRKTGVEILNREIKKQVYPDGMQYELDPHYHWESINIFFKALRMMDANGYRNEFPEEYLQTVEKMITIHFNYCFPDYTMPMFSDAKLHDRTTLLPDYQEWMKVFTDNQAIRYFATEGKEGKLPSYLSRTFHSSGFTVLRNGWTKDATVMVLKAGPKAFWHCQPDNGTFELWSKGRNFFPDSGSYVYAGDKEVMALRNWFRQTKVHNTLTLNEENFQYTSTTPLKWESGEAIDKVSFETPAYDSLKHRRTVWMVDKRFYVLLDEAIGEKTGEIELNYHLLECEPKEDKKQGRIETQFEDGNNILLQVKADRPMTIERKEGWVSRVYRHRQERPSYAFKTEKNSSKKVRFATLILPIGKDEQHKISLSILKDGSVRLKLDGKRYLLK